jgi:DNA modification methylase
MIDVQIGDSRELVHNLEDESIDCVMTSPPYWGLRDYGHGNQIGSEPTPGEYLSNLISIFSNIRLKLKETGNCFVNLGDTYYNGSQPPGTKVQGNPEYNKNRPSREATKTPSRNEMDFPTKSLCMIPERFAWEMIQRGWILRNKIIWHKPNPMPESVTDRLTKTYEVIYHFTKSQKYYYDLDSIREPHKENSMKGISQNVDHQQGSYRGIGGTYKTNGPMKAVCNPSGKNPGDVWSINTKPYSKAHFAVYPLELVRKPILAGCPVGGTVLDPFGGSGTTAEFCRKNERDCIIFELNPEYEPLIQERAMTKIPDINQFCSHEYTSQESISNGQR